MDYDKNMKSTSIIPSLLCTHYFPPHTLYMYFFFLLECLISIFSSNSLYKLWLACQLFPQSTSVDYEPIIFCGSHHLHFITQTEWPFPNTKFWGVRKGKLIFTEIKCWEGGSLIDRDNKEFPDPNQKCTDQNKNKTKSQPNNPKFDKHTKKIQQKKAFNIQK